MTTQEIKISPRWERVMKAREEREASEQAKKEPIRMYEIVNLDGSDYEEGTWGKLYFSVKENAVSYAKARKLAVIEWTASAGWEESRNNGRWEKY